MGVEGRCLGLPLNRPADRPTMIAVLSRKKILAREEEGLREGEDERAKSAPFPAFKLSLLWLAGWMERAHRAPPFRFEKTDARMTSSCS